MRLCVFRRVASAARFFVGGRAKKQASVSIFPVKHYKGEKKMNEVLAESKAKLGGVYVFWLAFATIALIVLIALSGGYFHINMVFLCYGIALVIILFYYLACGKNSIVVTKETVRGVTLWGKKVDIPVDSISAVGAGLFHSVAITSASGAINFPFMEKRDEVYEVINTLLSERQNNKKDAGPTTIVTQEMPKSEAEELKKFKELLDSGIITQEEFDAKKKQLLGL